MELGSDPTQIVHQADGKRWDNLWVLWLVTVLWILSIALYLPEMP
jgi:hypothetical protein